jgi:hypothetical protein
MPFVKLDCRILDSSLWHEKAQRDVFITALLLCEPFEVREPMPQLDVRTMEPTGWKVPPGWYGFAQAAGSGIIHRAMVAKADGTEALVALGEPELGSKNQKHEGRRLIRVDHGYIALNFMEYRERDHTAAERSKRWRERKKSGAATNPGPREPQSANGRKMKLTNKGRMDETCDRDHEIQ